MPKKMSKKTEHNNIRFWTKIRKWIFKIALCFFIISIVGVIAARFIPVWFTPLMAIRTVESVLAGNTPQIKKRWVSIDQISPHMIQAVVASEDNLFMRHSGFSFKDIEKAIKHNQKGKRMRGGSTISQQTAKNVFLCPHRSWIRKSLEAYFTVLIELFWPKKRIMEVYLNVIETGKGLYGVDAAAEVYFNKRASQLSKSQSALIAVCLPNPRIFNPAKPSKYIKKRQKVIMNLMTKIGKIDLEK